MRKTEFYGKADVIFKTFWRQNDRFASLFNTVIFGGKEVVKPEALEEIDTDISNTLTFGKYKETLARTRDVVKKAVYGIGFVVMGIENQQEIHYAMPLRVMIYDSLGYLKEFQEIVKHHRKTGDLSSTGEFLTGMCQEDRLHPIISIVIYYNESPWDGPVCLKDMVIKMPREIEQAFSDYKMNLLQVSASEQYQFQNENVQTAFETARYLYQGAFDKVQKQLGNRKIPSDVGAMIGVMTNSKLLIEEAIESRGRIDMCTALEQLEKKGEARGIEIGKARGIHLGEQRAKKEIAIRLSDHGMKLMEIAGVLDEKEETVKEWLKNSTVD